jgi:hypothetical protein
MEACKPLFFNELELVPLAGLEPATQGLGIPCSVHTELQGYQKAVRLGNRP